MSRSLDPRHIRWFLIAALLVLSYVIVLTWQQDYHGANRAVPVESASAPAAALPDTSEPLINSSSELPQVNTSSAPDPSTSANDIIEINNGTLRLLVDKNGGDIIHSELLNYKAQLDQPQPFTLLRRDNGRVYVAQSGLVGADGIDSSSATRPLYSSASNSYINSDATLQVDLTYANERTRVVKSFVLEPGSHEVAVRYRVDNLTSDTQSYNLFAQIMHDGQRPEVEGGGLGVRPYLGAALTGEETNYLKYDFEDMQTQPLRESVANGWIALVQHYFMSAWIPADKANKYNYSSRITSNGRYIVGFTSPAQELAPGASATTGSVFYAGPKTPALLAPLAPHIELAIDYGWLWFISEPLFLALEWLHSLVDNWGVAIILLTLCVKLVFFPLTQMSFKSMARMRKFAPQIAEIREQAGSDKQKLSQEMMKLYKRERINPMSGCLPILVQMPVFIALYWTLIESVELRHAPFMLWIHDLAVMDPYFVLPLLMGATMFIQQLLSPAPPDPTQAKIMRMLPIIFTFFFLWFPAGLTLYWVVNNTLSIAQQYVITRQLEKPEASPAK